MDTPVGTYTTPMDGMSCLNIVSPEHPEPFSCFGKVLKLGMDNPSIREASSLSKQLWYFELGVLDSTSGKRYLWVFLFVYKAKVIFYRIRPWDSSPFGEYIFNFFEAHGKMERVILENC